MLGDMSAETVEALSQLSDRAIIAYALGCSEWVVYSLLSHLPDDRALKYLEACWMFQISEDVCLPLELEEEDWKGLILEPVDLSMLTVINAVYFSDDEQAELQGAFAELIPLHVLGDSRSFLRWRGLALARLSRLYGRNSEYTWGKPVPREALDPGFPIERLASPRLLLAKFREEAADNAYVAYVAKGGGG